MHPLFSNVIDSFQNQDYLKAKKLTLEILKAEPENIDAYRTMGSINIFLEDHEEAISCFKKVLNQNDKDYDTNANLAHLYFEIEDFDNCDLFSSKALKIDPGRQEAYITLAKLHFIKKDYLNSKKNFEIAIKIAGGLEKFEAWTCIDYFDCLLANKEKKTCIDKIKKRQSNIFHPDVFYYLSNLSPNDINEEDLKTVMEKISFFKKEPNAVKRSEALIGIFFGLAYYYLNSNKRDLEYAEKFFDLGNNQINNVLRYAPFNSQKMHINTKKAFEKKYALNIPKNRGEGIIFIVGLPRSGTTLLESIIATCPDLFSAGELKLVNSLTKNLSKNFTYEDFNEKSIEAFGEEYVRRIGYLKRDYKFIVDKLPGNYLHIGMIAAALPAAKILHISRDPWDNAISLYQQRYVKNVPYSSSFFNIALKISNYKNIMGFWGNSKFNENILNIKYEDLIKKELEIANKVFNFCNLTSKYDPELRKNFFSNTASKNQVNQPIHSNSIQKKDIFLKDKSEFLLNMENQDKYWLSKS